MDDDDTQVYGEKGIQGLQAQNTGYQKSPSDEPEAPPTSQLSIFPLKFHTNQQLHCDN